MYGYNYIIKFIGIVSFIFSLPLFAQFELYESKIKSEIGICFGPTLVFPGTNLADKLNTSLGGGLFFRINLPNNTFRTEIGSSIHYYTSDGEATLTSIPTYIAESYSLPIDLPLLFQIKLGFGFDYLLNFPEKNKAIHPALFSGFEMSFPAGKVVEIGIQINYYFTIESYLSPPIDNPNFVLHNGHFISLGLMVNFNVN